MNDDPMTVSDEGLTKIAAQAFHFSDGLTWHEAMKDAVRAIRAALTDQLDDPEAVFFGAPISERVVRGRVVAIEHEGAPLIADEDVARMTDDRAEMDLAAVIWQAGFIETEPPPLHAFRTVPQGTMRRYVQMARAVRAARTEPVTPLAPGETVTIPDAMVSSDSVTLHGNGDTGVLYIEPCTVDSCPLIALDAAGVRALVQAGRRWLAANGGEK